MCFIADTVITDIIAYANPAVFIVCIRFDPLGYKFYRSAIESEFCSIRKQIEKYLTEPQLIDHKAVLLTALKHEVYVFLFNERHYHRLNGFFNTNLQSFYRQSRQMK